MAPEPKLSVSQENNVLSELSYSDVIQTSQFKPLIGMDKVSMTFNCKEVVNIKDWGFPGYLTNDEFAVFEKFRQELYRRDNRFKKTVFSFAKAQENEAYALCRWLRARKFNYSQVIDMVSKASTLRDKPAKYDFFPNPNDALGVEASIYLSQYPHMYYSHAKNDCPLFISRPGVLNVSGLECITTVEGILNYHWHDMMCNYMGRLNDRYQMTEGRFKRYEVVLIIDLNHLTAAQLTKKALNIMKIQTEIDSLCFPETLNRMIIINAPTFFTYTFKLIKNWVDVRTSNKVEMFGCNKAKWKKRLKELVEDHNLPVEYGGTGITTKKYIENNLLRSPDSKISHQKSHLMRIRSTASWKLTLNNGEIACISIFTRSSTKTIFQIIGPNGNKLTPQNGIIVRHKENIRNEGKPTRVDMRDNVSPIDVPGTFKIQAECFGGGMFSPNNFLLVAWIYNENVNNNDKVVPSNENESLTNKPELIGNSSSNPIDRLPVNPQSIKRGSESHYRSDYTATEYHQNHMEKEEFTEVTLSKTKSTEPSDESVLMSLTKSEEEEIINIYKDTTMKSLVVEEETPSTGFTCGEKFFTKMDIAGIFTSCLSPRRN